jgi:hypothetical protein
MFDPQIILFPYDRNESFPYRSFKRWVPPPQNSPPMTDVEKEEATTHHVSNPPLCKCRYQSELVNPPTGLDYTPFWRCPVPLSVIARKRCHSFVVMKVLILYSRHWITMCFVG